MLDSFDYVMENIDQFASLGDFYNDKNELMPEVKCFLSYFSGKIENIKIYPYGILTNFQEQKAKAPKEIIGPRFIIPELDEHTVSDYLKKDGDIYYSIGNRSFHSDYSKHQKRKDLIWEISIRCDSQPEFSSLRQINLQVLRKFIIPCVVERVKGNNLWNKDLNEIWNDLKDSDHIRLFSILKPKIISSYNA